MKKARFGVIGCGSIAEIAHFPSIQRTEGAELVACCDINEETAKQAAEKAKATAAEKATACVSNSKTP